MLQDLGIEPICEGIETVDEFDALRDLGVTLMQGYLLARPALSSLAKVEWPDRPQPIAQTA
jgi:EAL domain-containing protein (putative c-di-GMP-specific phosphodiesterase class I)